MGRKALIYAAFLALGATASLSASISDPFVGITYFDYYYGDFTTGDSGELSGSYGSGVVGATYTAASSSYSVATVTGQIGPATGLTMYDTPVVMDITNLTISCGAAADVSCGSFYLNFNMGLFAPSGYIGDLPVAGTLSGTSTGGFESIYYNVKAQYGNADGPASGYNSFTGAYAYGYLPEGPFDLDLFDTTLLTSDFTGTPNNIRFFGSFSGTLFGGQSLTLPNSLTLNAAALPSGVPEPGALVLLGGGLLGLAWTRRRRNS